MAINHLDVSHHSTAPPDKFNYSSGGIGTGAHLAAATFISLAGIKAAHVPLKGSVEIAGSLMRGETHFAFPTAGTATPQMKGGRLRALAVTGAQRLKELPDVPTLHEVMGSDLTIQDSWFGFWAPLNTPEDIARRLHAAISQGQTDASIKTAFEAAGNAIAISESPKAFAQFMRRESKKWADIIRIASVSG
jgi:tripartite-type tricarboxylate transporter receptor subunit TctC